VLTPSGRRTAAHLESVSPALAGDRPSWRMLRLEKILYQRQIEAADAEIDALVYELHGLTEEEIAIVEGRDH
jgi:hypothetical protein